MTLVDRTFQEIGRLMILMMLAVAQEADAYDARAHGPHGKTA